MSGYDYNTTYGPLKVYDQGVQGDCVYYSRALAVAAVLKMRTGVEPTWVDPDFPRSRYVADSNDWAKSAYQITIGGTAHAFDEGAALDKNDPAALTQAILDHGVLHMYVLCPGSLNVVDCLDLPVFHVVPGEAATLSHAITVVGVTDDGLLIQNQWGYRWGYHGRGVLGWDWIAQYAEGIQSLSVDYTPAVATRPAVPFARPFIVPARKESRMIVRFAGKDDVYEVVGSHLEHVTSQAYIARDRPPVTDLPATHPLAALPKTNGAA